MNNSSFLRTTIVVASLLGLLPSSGETLKVFLLLGQSNMEGQAYTYDNEDTAGWNIPTMEFLLSGTPAATNYLAALPFEFKDGLAADWLIPRDDVWCVHHDSANGNTRNVLPTKDPAGMINGVAPLSPGFGVGTNFGSMIGAELSMGIRLGEASDAPVFLFKSAKGGTTLGNDWRPPTAVAKRGGDVGPNYTNTITQFLLLLDAFDADLADDGLLNDYGGATGYEVAGVFWLQGWNEKFADAPYSAAQLQAEYADNLRDLIYSIRASDPRIPGDLGLIVGESSDQEQVLNDGRMAAVEALNTEIPNSAAYFDSDNMIGVDWGSNNDGQSFSQNWGFHFHARAENFLELGWKAAGAALANGYIEQGPLQLGVPRVTALSFMDAGVTASINVDAEEVHVVWDTQDRGKGDVGDWSNSQSLGPWVGGAGQLAATLDGLAENTPYVFRFYATDPGLGASDWSGLGTLVTPFENPPPLLGVPTNTPPSTEGAILDCALTRAPATSTHVVWAFEDQGESDLSAWENAPGGGSADLGAAAVDSILSHELGGLEPSTQYFVRFLATNDFGSVWSRELSFRTARPADDFALTAYYDFEGSASEALLDFPGAGSFADDLSGYNAAFATADVPPLAKGSSQVATFDGNAALFTNAYTSDLGPDPDAFTIMFWVKGVDAEQENGNTRLMTTRVRPDGSNSSTPAWQIEGFGNNGSNGDKMDLRMNDPLPGNWFSPDATNALANNGEVAQWRHVTFVVANSDHPNLSGNGYSRTFVDGVQTGLEAEVPWNGLALGNSDGQLIIGGHTESAGGRAFSGSLDDVALFAGIVPDAEIAAIAEGRKSPAEFLVADSGDVRLSVRGTAAGLQLTWNSRDDRTYTVRTDDGTVGSADPGSWPVYLTFDGVESTPPLNTLLVPYPSADREAFFVVEEVPAP